MDIGVLSGQIPLILNGHSLGGTTSYLLGIRNPGTFNLIIMINPGFPTWD